ncbi:MULTISPECIES: hypothetical protein [unclassified Sulfitobacter]|uniref:hypothetical protein n=1 Tax=unclassified Sulfitobacter TaxID=196795 RepID=UPI0023E116C4|nr:MULTISPECIES: hypothetical protein [unclassified Sulfitobacter]MDF3383382.1 hypothetical protein [Sulfitobacter sp. Ks11]MDF3386801.1 hypothetical protein [Sulfitobacter sp. M85]MDF3390220.1 hypothetical protein [Sulfitobacter sp. Ks16]MDF3400857.1 hypothetical protein [Sulfitobacter sp. KE39]MDF3404278.1 hypothetical protein [Sulfitobacter sp. Ks35]
MLIVAAVLGAILGAVAGLGVAAAVVVCGRGSIWPGALPLLVFAGAGIGALVPVLGAAARFV